MELLILSLVSILAYAHGVDSRDGTADWEETRLPHQTLTRGSA